MRDLIARAVLGDGAGPEVRVGTVTLRPHQREALRRVRGAIAEFGGALLADDPGLGKTYVALALAREYGSAMVIAPAALRGLWRDAARRAEAEVTFHSFEALSRRHVAARPRLLIVDEAHHACNPRAHRYPRLALLATGAPVFLLSATPVRNRRSELDALLALFLGPRAAVLDDAGRSRCVIRRGNEGLELPAVDGPRWHRAPSARAHGRGSAPDIARAITRLPPPLPALDGREARALLTLTLTRCWASSLAALDASLRRRLQRGAALDAVLDAGRVPTRRELRAWVLGDDAVQLAFPLLADRVEPDADRLRRTLRAHLDAVEALRAAVAPFVRRDALARAALLERVAAGHPRGRVVAFTSYRATAEALYRALRRRAGVALLTAGGARSAGGARPREDILRALGPRAGGAPSAGHPDDISLVLATDVLSEGVNLQGASVVVHLDVPWTPAGLDQRVGRAARMGSGHACVHVHGIAAPASAERLLRLERRLLRKHGESRAATRAPMDAERLRRVVAPWRVPGCGSEVASHAVAVLATRPGFLAVLHDGSSTRVLGGVVRSSGSYRATDDPAVLVLLAEAAGAAARNVDPRTLRRARAALRRWTRDRRMRAAIAAGDPTTSARRALLERLDRLLAQAPAATRATLAARIGVLQARAEAAVGAGAEQLLRELVTLRADDPERWLRACEGSLARAWRPVMASPGPAQEAAVALLILMPDGIPAHLSPSAGPERTHSRSAVAAILEGHAEPRRT